MRPAERDILAYTQPDATLSKYAHVERVPRDDTLVRVTLPVQLTLTTLFEDAPDLTV